MLFANLDVTTHVLTWAITLVADHDDEKAKLREEIAANQDHLEEYITRTDTHLHRCYYESLRLRPLAREWPFISNTAELPGATESL
jgi:cytochrome P450